MDLRAAVFTLAGGDFSVVAHHPRHWGGGEQETSDTIVGKCTANGGAVVLVVDGTEGLRLVRNGDELTAMIEGM